MPCTIKGLPISIKGRIYREEREANSIRIDDNTDTIDTVNLASVCKPIHKRCESIGCRGLKIIRNCRHIQRSIPKIISNQSINSVRKNYDPHNPISSNNNIRNKLTIHRIGYYYKMFIEEGRYSVDKRDWDRYCKENK